MYQRDSFLMKETNHDDRFSFILGPILTHKTRWSSAGFVVFQCAWQELNHIGMFMLLDCK